jgi:hypothetical protein
MIKSSRLDTNKIWFLLLNCNWNELGKQWIEVLVVLNTVLHTNWRSLNKEIRVIAAESHACCVEFTKALDTCVIDAQGMHNQTIQDTSKCLFVVC